MHVCTLEMNVVCVCVGAGWMNEIIKWSEKNASGVRNIHVL